MMFTTLRAIANLILKLSPLSSASKAI